ncbi:MAG: asparaginase [Fusobacterium sp.]|uniref:asparaginase n=1 Tax=Fusobacterium sp. TaxID=68766 RepID=UPI0026DB0B9F|nr:asparaginase [Fusobacterium sp.]MDO4690264.1 asparaginase [Fusobacterium sp.]
MKDKILIINTGGTIGMVGNPLRPAYNWQEITAEHPVLKQFPTDYYQFETLIDSSDANPSFWLNLAEVIKKNYDKYIGFVILHGTDTMAYTGSMLSYMFKNLAKPVILTGAQSPLVYPRSDGLQNLINSIYIAGHKLFNISLVPEVCICFRDTLLRANRSKKTDSNNYYGFSSPNYLPLAELASEIKIIHNRILPLPNENFYLDKSLNSNVIMLELFPGMNPKYLREFFKIDSDIEALILKTYGSGNTPTDSYFIDSLKSIAEQGIPILDVTQCVSGSVKMPLYESTDTLSKMGVISGSDITSEAAITKMMYLLGKKLSLEEIKKAFKLSICGEQTV